MIDRIGLRAGIIAVKDSLIKSMKQQVILINVLEEAFIEAYEAAKIQTAVPPSISGGINATENGESMGYEESDSAGALITSPAKSDAAIAELLQALKISRLLLESFVESARAGQAPIVSISAFKDMRIIDRIIAKHQPAPEGK